jgi:hypothetical protein
MDGEEFKSFFQSFVYFLYQVQAEVSKISILLFENLRSMDIECIEFGSKLITVGRENVWLILGCSILDGFIKK